MLRKYSNSRTLSDNIKLGVLTAFVAGMVNVGSLLLFLSFSSNVTGYYAILAAEIVKGNIHQFLIVGSWISLFFLGSFTSNLVIIHFDSKNRYLAHAIPVMIEIACLLAVGFYGDLFYKETLRETEILLTLMIFAMGIQNGLTASISNFAVKTTHLTGATTDLGILLSMFTKKEYRNNRELVGKAQLILSITLSYIVGAIASAFIYQHMMFKMFYFICMCLVVVIAYDWYKMKVTKFFDFKKRKKNQVPSMSSEDELQETISEDNEGAGILTHR